MALSNENHNSMNFVVSRAINSVPPQLNAHPSIVVVTIMNFVRGVGFR